MIKKLLKLVKIITIISACVATIAFAFERIEEKKNKNLSIHKPYGIYEHYIKRPLDAFLATGALIVFSPILLITGLLVRIKLGRPVIFTQDRPGKDGKIFKLYKFRTMTNEKDKNGNLLSDEERTTKVGTMIRSTSLDEFPELLNIIKGDMAVVGPRPLLPEYLNYYTDEESHRHDVRPGLTGLAQINGRSFITWEQIFQYDLKYVNNLSFLNDLFIVIKTVKKVFKREDIADTGDDKNVSTKRTIHQPLNIERKK